MSEELDDAGANEEAATSEVDNTEIEGEIQEEGGQEEGQQVEGEAAKADGSFVETDNANIQARFNKITSQTKTEKARGDALQARLDKIDADNLQAIINKPAPTEEQFDFDSEAHQAAAAAHNQAIGEARGAQAAQLQAAQQRQFDAQTQLNQAYGEKVVKFAEKTPDFVDSVSALQGLNPQIMAHIQGMENAPEFAYELSKNMNLAQQLNNAANANDGLTAGNIIGQIQNAIKSAPKDKKVTKAGGTIDSPIQGGISPDDPNKKYKHSSGAVFE